MSLPYAELAPGIRKVADEARSRIATVSDDVRSSLRIALFDDMVTEYDARFLVAYLDSLDVPFCPEFGEVLAGWYRDEVRHFGSFRNIYEACFGDATDDLAGRRPDFSSLAHLFRDEFEILCLLAYDELTTLRGYRGNLPMYDHLGRGLGDLARRVIGDEAGHYAAFRALLIARHRERLGEVASAVERIRATDGSPYRATFVLDHDDPVYGDHIYDDSARVLISQAERARLSSPPGTGATRAGSL